MTQIKHIAPASLCILVALFLLSCTQQMASRGQLVDGVYMIAQGLDNLSSPVNLLNLPRHPQAILADVPRELRLLTREPICTMNEVEHVWVEPGFQDEWNVIILELREPLSAERTARIHHFPHANLAFVVSGMVIALAPGVSHEPHPRSFGMGLRSTWMEIGAIAQCINQSIRSKTPPSPSKEMRSGIHEQSEHQR